MFRLYNTSGIYFKNYKSFSATDFNELTNIKKINLIIGKNNCGKSSILDIIQYILNAEIFTKNNNRFHDIEIVFPITEKYYKNVFRQERRGGKIIGDHFEYAKQNLENELIRLNIQTKNNYSETIHFSYKFSEFNSTENFKSELNTFWEDLAEQFSGFFVNYKFKRLNADRNIAQENESDNEALFSNGNGATNIIRKFINYFDYDEKLIQNTLLNELNKIMNPESNFSNIKIQQIEKNNEDYLWEIFLEEKNNGRFALSQSGSGLKTIILILLNLLIIPYTQEYKDKRIVYAFEEIENNLHPALQRKIFDYLYEFATKNDKCIFLTTHSHVAINAYYGKEEASIFHVIKANNISTIKYINNDIDKFQILDDLDVRASDLFQSNGIIWVEGPSDRIYLKRWLEVLIPNNIYEEGRHYQFLYYGGRLLSHYTTVQDENLINVLLTNRNSAIIIDSDKKNNQTRINDTKKRIRQEFLDNNMFCWITKGREIENYISKEAINQTFHKQLNQCEQYEYFPDYIEPTNKNFKKVNFAHRVSTNITKENSNNVLDLKDKILELYETIKKWNNN